jgi:hypothetical protein
MIMLSLRWWDVNKMGDRHASGASALIRAREFERAIAGFGNEKGPTRFTHEPDRAPLYRSSSRSQSNRGDATITFVVSGSYERCSARLLTKSHRLDARRTFAMLEPIGVGRFIKLGADTVADVQMSAQI